MLRREDMRLTFVNTLRQLPSSHPRRPGDLCLPRLPGLYQWMLDGWFYGMDLWMDCWVILNFILWDDWMDLIMWEFQSEYELQCNEVLGWRRRAPTVEGFTKEVKVFSSNCLLPVLCGSVSFSPRRWEHFWIFQVNALCDPSTGAIIQKIVQDKYRSLPCTIMWTHSWRIHVKPPSDCRNPRIYVKLPGNRMSNLYGQSTRKSWAILEVAQDQFVSTSAHALLNPPPSRGGNMCQT